MVNNTFTKFSSLLILAVLLAGCQAAGPHTRTLTILANGGNTDLPETMRNVNLAAYVAFDERHVSKAYGFMYTTLYVSDMKPGSELAKFRYVHINTSLLVGAMAWKKAGTQLFPTAAFVPDHIGMLRQGDIVEYRSINMWDSNLTFAADNEGQVVLRVLCRKADPEYAKCLDAAPNFHGIKATGATGTPFAKSVSDYGFKFSKFYDDKGKLLMPLPQPGSMP